MERMVLKRSPLRVTRSSSQESSLTGRKENLTPQADLDTPTGPPSREQRKMTVKAGPRSPFTPVQNLVLSMKERLENQLGASLGRGNGCSDPGSGPFVRSAGPSSANNSLLIDEKTSPGLAKLRMTPAGKGLKEKQKILLRKHQESKNNCDNLNVGGGISIWPGMENMRLTREEAICLGVAGLSLFICTVCFFNLIHGSLVSKLMHYTEKLAQFPVVHQLDTSCDSEIFSASVLSWHTGFTKLLDEIHNEFDGSWSKTSYTHKMCVILYVLGIATLLFFLMDNILAKSKLTPRRIKSWVCLLVIITTWTMLTINLLLQAQRLEHGVEFNVHILNNKLADLVYLNLDLTMYHNVLIHWRTKCLPPTGLGTLTIMGLLPVQDVAYYLQYYSVTMATALLTPVVQLFVSLKEVYSTEAIQ